MKSLLLFMGSCFTALLFYGCTPQQSQSPKEEQYLSEQEEQQGYPVLIASPVSADYGLPFCEKQYCLDIEIFSFKSQDEWFNQFVDQQIADLIRQKLGLTQKHSLQNAVNEFVRLSDAWQEEHETQPWSIFVDSRVALQQDEITLLQITTEYQLGDQTIPQQVYYFVADRKSQKSIKLYDVIQEKQRVAFGLFLQQEYKKWVELQPEKEKFPDKIYWANQDWFFDDDGIAIYYRGADFTSNLAEENLTIYLSKEQIKQWVKSNYLKHLDEF